MLVVKQRQIAVQPGEQVYAIGDRSDRNFPDRQLGPQLLPHFLRNLAMQAADRVAKGGSLNGGDRHREWLVMILEPEPAQRQELLERYAGFGAILAEVFVQQTRLEQIDSGRDGRMGGEDAVGAAGLQRFLKGQLVLSDEAPHALDRQEGRVTFVHVPDGGLQTEPVERAQAANPQDNFLPDPGQNVAAVELVGDLAVFDPLVFRDVGV